MAGQFSGDDHYYMARALGLAERGLFTTTPNPRVGCVLVNEGEVVGEGWHHRAGEPHAEILALKEAAGRARGATAYVTLEPCSHQGKTPPCSVALIAAGVGRVISAMEDPNPLVAGQGLRQLTEAGIVVASGLLAEQAERLNPGFTRRMRNNRPFVRNKLAMSLDGRTAMASGESQWITSTAARHDVQQLRARSCAIMAGIGTVLSDDPSLTVRLPGWDGKRQPLRVILDPRLSTPLDAKLLSEPGRTLVVAAVEDPDVQEQLEARGAGVALLPHGQDAIDLHALMELLSRMEINELLLETGATLSGAMLRAGLVDELVIYMAPKLMGDSARGLFRLPGLDRMDEAIDLTIEDVRSVGSDWRITARVANTPTVELA